MFGEDKHSMMDMFQSSLEKQKWKHVLFTVEFFGVDDLKFNEATILRHEWNEILKQQLSDNDATLVVNEGNIFVLLHLSHAEKVMEKLKNVILFSKKCNGGIRFNINELTSEESEFLIKNC